MEGVIKSLETRHKDKYKVYNLCSERLYDASLFEGRFMKSYIGNICARFSASLLFILQFPNMLEEIKIIDVEIYVNPYSELDEEEEEKAKAVEKEDEQKDQVGSWYSNPGIGATEGQTSGGGVGKYLKARNVKAQSATVVYDELPSVPATKKRKAGVSTQELKDFSGW
ncbi:hypothetical protein LIER_32307 [Lithospermum erythrorhizon]|uniref:Uncharacterized protein n=1 Tax=Lithospermum erythrorhizon TaxID=34254 RepID=A0AAV3RUF6_LITER